MRNCVAGSAVDDTQSFKEFDPDRDEKCSLLELRAALGVIGTLHRNTVLKDYRSYYKRE